MQGRPLRLGDVGRGRATQSRAKLLCPCEDGDVQTAPLDDAADDARRSGGFAERRWGAMIKDVGKLVGVGDALPPAAEPDDEAEDGLRCYNCGECSVAISRDAHFLPRVIAAGAVFCYADMLLREGRSEW